MGVRTKQNEDWGSNYIPTNMTGLKGREGYRRGYRNNNKKNGTEKVRRERS